MHKNEKLLILGILTCLLVGVIGYSFAYFTANVVISGEGAQNSMNAADLIKVEYDAGTQALTLENAVPGNSPTKEFNVNIKPTSAQKNAKYAINLNITANTFTKCLTKTNTNDCLVNADEIVLTLKRKIDGGTEEVLVSNKDITGVTGNIVLLTEDLTFADTNQHVYSYVLEMAFVNTGYDQNHNINKSLSGTINVAFVE